MRSTELLAENSLQTSFWRRLSEPRARPSGRQQVREIACFPGTINGFAESPTLSKKLMVGRISQSLRQGELRQTRGQRELLEETDESLIEKNESLEEICVKFKYQKFP